MIRATLALFAVSTLGMPLLRAQDSERNIDPVKAAAIEEIFSLTNMQQMLAQSLAQSKAMVSAQFEKTFSSELPNEDRSQYLPALQKFENQMFALMADRLSWEKLKPRYVQLYDDTFTTAELTGIASFYKTPTGRALLQKMPVLMTKSMSIAQEQLTDVMPEIQRMATEFLENMKNAHEHKPPSDALRH